MSCERPAIKCCVIVMSRLEQNHEEIPQLISHSHLSIAHVGSGHFNHLSAHAGSASQVGKLVSSGRLVNFNAVLLQ